MSAKSLYRLFVIVLLTIWPAMSWAQNTDILPAEEAFHFSVERDADDRMVLRWQIENGYYLYRDHLMAREGASGEALALETEPGIVESDDSIFGPSEVYYHEAIAPALVHKA